MSAPAQPQSTQAPQRLVPLGLFVVLEGIDGAGKTTQAQRLVQDLSTRGYHAVYEHEPTAGPHGRELRRLVAEGGQRLPVQDEFRLFLLDRQDNMERTIVPTLRAGGVLILDRYYISSMAYQGARGLDPLHIRDENERIALRPDLLIMFDLSPEVAQQRRSARGLAANDFEIDHEQQRVAHIFNTTVAQHFPAMVHINAGRAPDDVYADLLALIITELDRRAATSNPEQLDVRFGRC